mmetsp:Transcript_30179/g.73442  ORF Transcript_30179/g.73442 Transcript_30179/m.73442 type:complete len:162 (-) Transcript_30179:194-679(-)
MSAPPSSPIPTASRRLRFPTVPKAFREYFAKAVAVHKSLPEEVRQKALKLQIDEKKRDAHFEEADANSKDGVLDADEYKKYTELEFKDFCDFTGATIPYDDDLHKAGFAAIQFEGKKGVTKKDLETAEEMGAKVLQEMKAAADLWKLDKTEEGKKEEEEEN